LAALGNYSASVSVDVPVTIPGAVRALAATIDATGIMNVSWLAPSDNGGSPITGYSVERLVSGSWTPLANLNTTSLSLDKEAPGSVVELRIAAKNVVGSSALASLKTNFPYVQSDAVSGLTTVVSGSSLVVSWSAPVNTGGSPVSYYSVERSLDQGSTWSSVSSVRSGTSYTTPAPAKGTSVKFRIAPVTLFGKGKSLDTELVSTALTVPGAPTISTRGFNPDGSYYVTWRKPFDNGGSPITGYIVEKSIAGVWTKLAEFGPNDSTVNMARDLPGTAVGVRITALNSVGSSVPSPAATYQIPAVRASAPQQVAVVSAGVNLVSVSWQAPAALGGSPLTNYLVQLSRDGGKTWVSYYASPTASSLRANGPAKGTTWQYRVVATTSGAGISETSSVISFTS
jgi:titin